MIFRLFTILTLCFFSYGFAVGQIGAPNLKDGQGKPQGFWYVQHEARMGEPPFTEFGSYDHGRKTGLWYKVDAEGSLVAVERYANNTLHGESKYFESGRLAVTGIYRGLNPAQDYDTIWVPDPVTGVEKPVVISTERGSLRHGLWRYYDTQTGRLAREEEYQVDDLIAKKVFGLTGEDSAYYRTRTSNLPHNRNPNARASAAGRLTR
jgi:hypothetical protein